MAPEAHPPDPGNRTTRNPSHRYCLSVAGLVPVVLAIATAMAWVLGGNVLLNSGHPTTGRRPGNPDEAGFEWKRRAAAAPGECSVVFSGDSACATGVDSLLISEESNAAISCLNLGLIIDLPLRVYADALQRAASASHGDLRLAVLLVSPQRIGHTVSGPYFENLWQPRHEQDPAAGHLPGFLADCRRLWRSSTPLRLIEDPLRSDGRLLYGFASGVMSHMDRHNGAIVDAGDFRPGRREESGAFEPSPEFPDEAAGFRAVWTGQIPLAVAIAPIPQSYAPAGYAAQRERLLALLQSMLEADTLLPALPGTLPDGLFASPTHLNAAGQAIYSRLLAKALTARVESRKPGQDPPRR